MKKLFLLFALIGQFATAQVKDYNYSLLKKTYLPLAGGTIFQSGEALNTDTFSNEISLPFAFTISGTSYNSLKFSNNGFATLGKGLNNGFTMDVNVKYPISNTVKGWAVDYVISGFGNNLCASQFGTPEIKYGVNATNDFVIQYQDLAILGFNQTRVTFQIIFKADGKTIQLVYGPNNKGQDGATGSQVGLRGKMGFDELSGAYRIVDDFNNRKLLGTGDWNTVQPNPNITGNSLGQMPSSSMAWWNSSGLPILGLTFQYNK